MKERSLPSRALLSAAAFAFATSLHAQSNATPPALGLLRLKTATRASEAAPLTAGKFAVDDLSPAGTAGAAKSKRSNVDYLALDAGKEWARPLRGNPHDVTFVSFQVYGSQSTIVDVGGVKFGVTASDVSNYAQLMVKSGAEDWRALGVHLPFQRFDGKLLAALPVLTVRLDPIAGVFDVYSDARLLADNLPLGASAGPRRFTLTPGSDGAWITGLVQADENPLYEDANANGIDDQFEQRKNGRLLAANAQLDERKQLAREWRAEQLKSRPPALFYNRPRPDGK